MKIDNSNPFGPCIVSAGAIPDPQKIPLKSTVNGVLLQDGNTSYVLFLYCVDSYSRKTSNQIFSVRRTVSFLSQGTTLEPGTIIITGTPGGVGFARKPPVYLKNGDKVSVWLGNGIGTLANNVREEGHVTAKL